MGTADARQRLLARFRETTRERVDRIVAGLLDFDAGRVDRSSALEGVARELHTLKGEAAMMGFPELSRMAHAAEDGLGEGADPGNVIGIVRAIPGLLQGPAPARVDESAASARSTARPTGPPPGPARPIQPAEVRLGPATVRVEAGALDELASLGGDLRVDGASAHSRARQLSTLMGRWVSISDRFLKLAERRGDGPSHAELDAVAAEVHRLRSAGFRLMRHHLEAVEVVQGRLQLLATKVEEVRLVSLEASFPRFRIAARELARSQGKRLTCEQSGGTISVDREVLLALDEVLLHLVRNAVDHGLEPPAEREREGKPPEGTLEIAAHTESDQLVVVVRDDGRGIEPRRILDAAVNRGIVSCAAVPELPEAQVLDFIFAAGFTTRDEASDVSGRGVGLDVVRRTVAGLGGSVSVKSTPRKGTSFTVRLPQSLLLLKVLLLEVDGELVAIAAADVDSVDRLRSPNLVQVGSSRSVRHRDDLVPLVPLAPLLGFGNAPGRERPALAFVRHGEGVVALAVDRLIGQREVTIKPLGAFLRGLPLVSGAATMEDGRVSLLLATGELLAATRSQQPVVPSPQPGRRRRALVVDDSPVARELTASLLRSLGYDVETAQDGEEGFLRLERGHHDLLVTDVEMPVLDGLQLTRKLRSVPALRHLPVIIVSSMAGPDDRRGGIEAGADVYLGKGELEPAQLAATLDRLSLKGRTS